MAVSFGTSGTITSGSSTVSTLSATANLGTLTNGCIVVCLQTNTTTTPTLTAQSFGSTTVSAVASTLTTNAGTGFMQWYAAVGVTGSATLTFTWSSGAVIAYLQWKSFSGVNQTGGSTSFNNGTIFNGTGSQTSAPSNQTVTTVSGDASVYGWNVGSTFTGTQTPTQDTQQNTAGQVIGESQHRLSVSTSDAYNCLLSSADQINGAGFHIAAAAASTTLFVFSDDFGNDAVTKKTFRNIMKPRKPMIIVPKNYNQIINA